MEDVWTIVWNIDFHFVLLGVLVDLCLWGRKDSQRRAREKGNMKAQGWGRVSHFLCPPIISLLQIVGKSSDNFDFGAMALIFVLHVRLFL